MFAREFETEPAAIERAAAEPRGSWVLVVHQNLVKPHCQIRRWGFLFA